MSKRVKQQLPSKEHFSLALKLSGIIEEEIVAYEHRQMIANTQLNDANFLNTGANNVTVTETNVCNPVQVTGRWPLVHYTYATTDDTKNHTTRRAAFP